MGSDKMAAKNVSRDYLDSPSNEVSSRRVFWKGKLES